MVASVFYITIICINLFVHVQCVHVVIFPCTHTDTKVLDLKWRTAHFLPCTTWQMEVTLNLCVSVCGSDKMSLIPITGKINHIKAKVKFYLHQQQEYTYFMVQLILGFVSLTDTRPSLRHHHDHHKDLDRERERRGDAARFNERNRDKRKRGGERAPQDLTNNTASLQSQPEREEERRRRRSQSVSQTKLGWFWLLLLRQCRCWGGNVECWMRESVGRGRTECRKAIL